MFSTDFPEENVGQGTLLKRLITHMSAMFLQVHSFQLVLSQTKKIVNTLLRDKALICYFVSYTRQNSRHLDLGVLELVGSRFCNVPRKMPTLMTNNVKNISISSDDQV